MPGVELAGPAEAWGKLAVTVQEGLGAIQVDTKVGGCGAVASDKDFQSREKVDK